MYYPKYMHNCTKAIINISINGFENYIFSIFNKVFFSYNKPVPQEKI